MANEVYISAGLSIKKSSGDSSSTNVVYISAGLSPQKVAGAGNLPINVTGSCSFSGEVTRKVLYNRSVEGEI